MNQLPHFFQDEPIDSANQNAADLCVYKRKTYINYNMMTEGNRDKVWRPPKLFTVYQNACKQQTDKAACQTNFEKVFDCDTAATQIPGAPAGCSGARCTTTAEIPANAALNHEKCSFICDQHVGLPTTYGVCVTDAKAAAELIIPTHEVPGKKDEDPYFCCNKQLEETLFNNWLDWDTCQFSEPASCIPSDTMAADGTTVLTPNAMGTCKNHYSTVLPYNAASPAIGSRGISFEL